MIYLLRQCPLCKKQLIESSRSVIVPQTNWECPTRFLVSHELASDKLYSHYSIDEDGISRMFVGKYQIINEQFEKFVIKEMVPCYHIYKIPYDKVGAEIRGTCYSYVVTVPKFEITSEEQLLKKLSTIMVFS